MKTLDDQLRDYYASQSMPEERAASILATGRTIAPRHRLAWSAAATVAALLALAAILVVAVGRLDTPDITDRVITEIAKNHSKRLAPEVNSGHYEELQAKLSRLDFAIHPASEFLSRDFELLGGRYCSIQSEFAGQLKLRERESGQACTLYVAPLNPLLRGVKSDTRVVDGVRVQVWIEDGRLFGLARDATE